MYALFQGCSMKTFPSKKHNTLIQVQSLCFDYNCYLAIYIVEPKFWNCGI